MKSHPLSWHRAFFSLSAMALVSCGAPSQGGIPLLNRSSADEQPKDRILTQTELEHVRLVTNPHEQVLDSLVVTFNDDTKRLHLAPSDAGVVEMQASQVVSGSVGEEKYLRLTGSLKTPAGTTGEITDIGCLAVELKDNVYYREKTSLRVATSGVFGDKYTEVKIPLLAQFGSWTEIPQLPSGLDLSSFVSNSIKKFNGSLCFQLDFSNAPAQLYQGQIVVQYIREGQEMNSPDCKGTQTGACSPESGETADHATPTPQFACRTDPSLLRAGQNRTLEWTNPSEQALAFRILDATGSQRTDLGSIETLGKNQIKYFAPESVAKAEKVFISARHMEAWNEVPQLCEVSLMPKDDLGIADDKETSALVGNVYQIPNNSTKLPDFSRLKPLATLIAANLPSVP